MVVLGFRGVHLEQQVLKFRVLHGEDGLKTIGLVLVQQTDLGSRDGVFFIQSVSLEQLQLEDVGFRLRLVSLFAHLDDVLADLVLEDDFFLLDEQDAFFQAL